MLIEVNTGTMAMVGYQPSFTVECYEKNCKKCALSLDVTLVVNKK